MKIVIVGAGLMGLSTAYYLSEEGHEVVVIDRQQGPGQETSFANAGMLHPSQASPWNQPGIALTLLKWIGREESPFLLRPGALFSLLGWGIGFIKNSNKKRFRSSLLKNARLARYNMACMEEFRNRHGLEYSASYLGTMKVFESEEGFNQELQLVSLYADSGVSSRSLSQEEVISLEPALAENGERLTGGIFYPDDETGDAYLFCGILSELANKNHSIFDYGVTVQRMEYSDNKITGIITSNGTYRADAYVIAAASFSPLIAGTAGLKLPIRPVKGYSITLDTGDWDAAPKMPVVDEARHIAITPLGKRLRVAGTAELNGFSTEINNTFIQRLIRQLQETYPASRDHINFDDVDGWCGLRPYCVDGVPILGKTPYTNLYLNTGHGHLGWTMAMGSGRLVADSISGQTTSIDLAPYGMNRF